MSEIISENPTFFDKLTAAFGDLDHFERQIQQLAMLAKVDLNGLAIDHLAVRMNDEATALRWHSLLSEGASLLKQSQVNGRPIALFQLNEAVKFGGKVVDVIELPFPKGKTYPVEGWEHIEAVFPMQANETVSEWIERTLAHFDLSENAQVRLKISQPEAEEEQLPNPTIAITVKNATLGNPACLKLHPYDIKRVIF